MLDVLRRPFDAEHQQATPCLQCGKPVVLKFNGGELDRNVCCGLTYSTEAVGYRLVVQKPRRVELQTPHRIMDTDRR